MWARLDFAQGLGKHRRRGLLAGLAWALINLSMAAPAEALPERIRSYAVVHSDASLTVRGHRIRLFGIFLPPSERVCETRLRPARCGSRAATALRTKVSGFVDCRPQFAYDDGSIAAICVTSRVSRLPGLDLGAWLIESGLALAGPDAPFSYRAIERIAESRGVGVWGRFVDRVR